MGHCFPRVAHMPRVRVRKLLPDFSSGEGPVSGGYRPQKWVQIQALPLSGYVTLGKCPHYPTPTWGLGFLAYKLREMSFPL